MNAAWIRVGVLVLWLGWSGDGLAEGPAKGPTEGSPVLSFPSDAGEVVETAFRHHPLALGVVLRTEAGDRVVVDGQELGRHPQVRRLSLLPDGSPVYWYQQGKRQYLHTPWGRVGPYDRIHVPDLDVLGRMQQVSPSDLGFRGGTRVVFAARDREGDWLALVRYPADPLIQEKRPLPTTRSVPVGNSVSHRETVPLRYYLIRDKVPLFIGTRGDRECVVMGTEEVGCGTRVALLAWHPDSGRTAFALQRGNDLELCTGLAWLGPYRNIDWISFGPDGQHLALVHRDGQGSHVVKDRQVLATAHRIESLVWVDSLRLSWLAESETGQRIHSGDEVHSPQSAVSGLLVGPNGSVTWNRLEQQGNVLWPAGFDLPLSRIVAQGFLADGTSFLHGVKPDGRHVAGVNSSAIESLETVSRVTLSPDASTVLIVGEEGGRRGLFLGEKRFASSDGIVQTVDWCSGNRPVVVVRRDESDCRLAPGHGEICCPRILATLCTDTPVPLCMDGGTYYLAGPSGHPAGPRYDEVPVTGIYRQQGGGMESFAGRREGSWVLVNGQGEVPLPGVPVMVIPGPEEGWYRVHEAGEPAGPPAEPGRAASQGWVTSRGSVGLRFQAVDDPFFLSGRTLYRARSAEGETWVLDGVPLGFHAALTSSPSVAAEGVWYWVGDDRQNHELVFHANE